VKTVMDQSGVIFTGKMDRKLRTIRSLAAAITRAASKQTYYTIRFFVDRPLVNDAYLAYAYFRWMDDMVDVKMDSGSDLGMIEAANRLAFLNRQKDLLEAGYRGEDPQVGCPEESMLLTLAKNDSYQNPGLQSYLRNMMAMIEFDARRCGRVISQVELEEYTRLVATAITDAMHYFIGQDDPTPDPEIRYLAVTAAHITHMLRDTLEDADTGYFNVPAEYLQAHAISTRDVESLAYRQWVCSRAKLAREYFRVGKKCIAQVKNLRCRLAGYAYVARFEWMLRVIERDHYCLRSEYRERKSLRAGVWMSWITLASFFASHIKNKPNYWLYNPQR
jgi:phytoene/squalene synthetase